MRAHTERCETMEDLPDYIPTGLLCDDDIALLSLDHGMITPMVQS